MKIKKIKINKPEFTVDIEVEDTHSYQLANGCVSHNTSSLILESASGIHAHHSHRYFRRVQCNKHDPVFKYFKQTNPHMVEESCWSANKTDEIVTFPLTINSKAKVKADFTALQHLEIIKSTYDNWIKSGTSKHCKKPVTHNVSATVVVKDDEWNEVINYVYNNRFSFAAISFLPYCGDKLYKQAPMESVGNEDDEKKWNDLIAKYKQVDYSKLVEHEDRTTIMQTVGCGGGACEVL